MITLATFRMDEVVLGRGMRATPEGGCGGGLGRRGMVERHRQTQGWVLSAVCLDTGLAALGTGLWG